MKQKQTGWFVWFETTMNQINMALKSLIFLIVIALTIQSMTIYFMIKVGLYEIDFFNDKIEFIKLYLEQFPGILFAETAYSELVSRAAGIASSQLVNDFWNIYFITSPIFMIVMVIGYKLISKQSIKMGKSVYERGAILVNEEEQIRKTKNIEHNFKLGKIPIPKTVETSHVMIIGSAGSGKTQTLKATMLIATNNTNCKNLVHDIKGDWISEFYKEGRDLIFNPMDARSLKWTVWNDIHDIMDLKNFCNWLIPDLPNKDPFWQNSARMILESIMIYLWDKELTTNAAIRDLLNMSGEELAEVIADYGKGAEFAAKKDSYMTLQAQMAFIDFLDDGDFSIREWIKEGKGTMFLSNTEKTEAIFKPVLSLFVNFFGSEILNLPDNLDRRIYLFLDEFTALQKLPKVIDLLKLGRSKGASVWPAFQDFQQLEKIYSREDMRTVINNTASIAVLQLKEPDAAAYFAKRFGKQEFIERNQTISMGVAANRDGLSFSEQRRDDFVVKDSEILTLPELTAFIMIKNIEGVTKTKIDIVKVPVINEPFVKREFDKQAQIAVMKKIQGKPSGSGLDLENEETIEAEQKNSEEQKENSGDLKGFFDEEINF